MFRCSCHLHKRTNARNFSACAASICDRHILRALSVDAVLLHFGEFVWQFAHANIMRCVSTCRPAATKTNKPILQRIAATFAGIVCRAFEHLTSSSAHRVGGHVCLYNQNFINYRSLARSHDYFIHMHTQTITSQSHTTTTTPPSSPTDPLKTHSATRSTESSARSCRPSGRSGRRSSAAPARRPAARAAS